ncbi:MAG TPA: (deoxy)nucleoside triphosphate pyrophosphohydrolase [Geobacteraceae bacterium]|nr:(deoxy)nucleoside triphosphate pyrophosphohydrolase [Geobacteraceae bacterium]
MSTLLVAAAIIEFGGKILLARRKADVPYPLLWEFPGGKVEAGEDPRDCVVREIGEELAIEIDVTGIYEVIFHRYPERDVLVLAYRCRWVSGEVRDLEVSEHCWVLPGDVGNFELLPADISLAKRIALEFGNGDSANL